MSIFFFFFFTSSANVWGFFVYLFTLSTTSAHDSYGWLSFGKDCGCGK